MDDSIPAGEMGEGREATKLVIATGYRAPAVLDKFDSLSAGTNRILPDIAKLYSLDAGRDDGLLCKDQQDRKGEPPSGAEWTEFVEGWEASAGV